MRRPLELCLRALAVSAAVLGTALVHAAGCSLIDASSDCSSACNTLKGCGELPTGDCGTYCASAVSGAPIAGCLDQLDSMISCAKANPQCGTSSATSCTTQVNTFTHCMEAYCSSNPDGQGCPGGDGGTEGGTGGSSAGDGG
jgi:hypothetical protein